MNTYVAIPHHDYPTQVRQTVAEKLQTLERYEDRVTNVHATLGREKQKHHVGLVATVANGATLVADVRGEALSEALSEAVQRLASQLRKVHDKGVQRRHGRL
jgi:ribosomal subunit interface protein